MRQRIKEIAASCNLSDEEIKPALKHGVNLEWLLEGEGQIFKSGAPQRSAGADFESVTGSGWHHMPEG
jgi:hypothetical protein